MFSPANLLALAATASGTILWDGRLNAYKTSDFLKKWSFSNEVGPYQYYIHGDGPVTEYVNLSPDYKNSADSGSKQGIQITINNSSVWNDDGMLRTELIPQTTAAINEGKVYYHFSVQHTGAHPPSPYEEHQVCFFESHFTEMKYGLIDGEQGTKDTHLRWEVNSESQWNVTFKPNVWHNIAYGIDFTDDSVTFYHSTGANDLVKTVGPVKVSASSNGADWHLGVLRLPSTTGRTDTAAEDWHFSGVYIENGELTTRISGPGGSSESADSAVTSATTAKSTETTYTSVTSAKKTKKTVISATSTKQTATSSASTKQAVRTKKSSATTEIQQTSTKKAPHTMTQKPTSSVKSTMLKTSLKSSPSSSELSPVSTGTSPSAPSVYGTTTLTSVDTVTATRYATSTDESFPTNKPQHPHHKGKHPSQTSSEEASPTSISKPINTDNCEIVYAYA